MDEIRPYLPQLAAALGIVVGAAGGAMASLETGDFLRYLGTGVFVGITVPIYMWRFHL